MYELNFIESLLKSIFEYLEIQIEISPSENKYVDFIITQRQKRIAIEVKNRLISHNLFSNVILQLKRTIENYNNIDEFILVTLLKPNPEHIRYFQTYFIENNAGKKIELTCYGIEDYIMRLLSENGIISNISTGYNNLNDFLLNVQLTINELKNSKEGDENKKQVLLKKLESNKNKNKQTYDGLKGHLSKDIITKLMQNDKAFEILCMNLSDDDNADITYDKVHSNTIIIYSDIKNYSTLVTISNESEFYKKMNDYYNKVCNSVISRNGFFYKFVGDAAVFFFNYPFDLNTNLKTTFANALLCSIEIINYGKNIFDEFQKKKDNNVITGTRIGIAFGELTPMFVGDIAYFKMEFLGNKINLAARLQKECDNNGILISNEFYHKLLEIDNGYSNISSILTQKTLEPERAKGQLSNIIALQIDSEFILENKLTSILNESLNKI